MPVGRAGASGAIGAVLCRLLVVDGWQVVGATRSPERAAKSGRSARSGDSPE